MPIRKKSTKKTGKKPPKASLRAGLKKKLQGARKVALLAVGSSLRGDDAAGLLVAEHLKTLPRLKKDTLKIFMGETAPENLTGEIKRYLPTHLIVIDSAEIGARAGEISLIEPRGDLGGVSFCSHSLPLTVMLGYLRHFLTCEVLIMGIQPKTIKFGVSMTAAVRAAARRAALAIHGAMSDVMGKPA